MTKQQCEPHYENGRAFEGISDEEIQYMLNPETEGYGYFGGGYSFCLMQRAGRAILRLRAGLAAAPAPSQRTETRNLVALLRAMAEEQVRYWRERQTHEKCPDDGLGEEGSYTPIGDRAAWSGGQCNGRYSEAEWWLKTIDALFSETGTPAKPAQSAESMREACAQAVEQHDRTSREWIPGSLWDTLTKEMAARIRAIPIGEPSPKDSTL